MQIIYKNAPSKLRVIFLRRLMMRIAQSLAYREGAEAIVTGESVGQVASQTLANLGAISSATSLPVLRPLCGMNKNEIIKIARQIGTYEISVKAHDDTCALFVPERPETRANIKEVLESEKNYDLDSLLKNAIKDLQEEQVLTFKTSQNLCK